MIWLIAAALAQGAEAITVVAVGDVLPHREVKATAREHGWNQVFQHITPMVRSADVAFANLESPVAPVAHKGIHGEVFNAPASLIAGLSDAGFDVLSLANNHAWDQGVDGLLETHRRVTDAGLVAVGAGATCADARAPKVVEVRGVKVAFVALSDLSNLDLHAGADAACVFVAGPVCEGDCGPDRDAIHYALDEDRILAAVRAADAVADVVVVSAHWGDEYRARPLPEYPVLAGKMVEAGATVVLGHHAHWLQPIERRGDAVVAYGLGNFVSGMGARFVEATSPPHKANTRDGVVLRLEIVVDEGKARVATAVATPVWTGRDAAGIVVQPHALLPEALRVQRRDQVEKAIESEWLIPRR
jgi:poly-gamma-glutamate synthesis protein (capsule biosynthesis protein)